MDEQRVVLVTGASSGFGRLMAEDLARRGHRVFAGLRDLEGRNKQAAAELAALDLAPTVVELDVTDQSSADRAIDAVLAAAGRLDVVVNNAGTIFPGPVEAFTAAEAHRQFDVNALGALRVNRAALPHLREQGSGVLIQIGSLASRVSLPFSGLYSASKAALSSLTEAWHLDLKPFGVESVIVEAAPYPTSIGLNAVMPADGERLGAYGEQFGAYVTTLTTRQTSAGYDADPQDVAEAVALLVESAAPRPRWTIVGPPAQTEAVSPLGPQAAAAALAVAEDMGVAAFM